MHTSHRHSAEIFAVGGIRPEVWSQRAEGSWSS